MHLLTDPLLPVVVDGGVTEIGLPALLAFYAEDAVRDLPFLRPHQQAPWHQLCVQLAALALHRAGEGSIPADAATWRELLRGLTGEWPDDEPWRLVVPDVTRPAFMQSPVPKGTADPHRGLVETPDDLDVLVTSKNHGVKQGQAGEATPAAWVAALVSLQTCGGYLGAGNFGVARMNGGFATRPCIGLVPNTSGPGARWSRDVAVLLRHRAWSLERVPDFAEEGGHALLWCLPWDGQESLDLGRLDPWFIEICRRVRLARQGERLVARTSVSAATRVAAKERAGNVGDPWIPIDLRKGSAAYNTAPRYPVMSAVLFDGGEWVRPLLLDWHNGIDGTAMTARFDVVVRGQGVTEGHHVREVPIEGQRRLSMLMRAADRDRLAGLAKAMVGDARDLRLKVLKIPLLTLAQAGPDEVDFRDRTSTVWVEPFLQRVDDAIEPVFFDHLFDRIERGAEADRAWGERLHEIARTILQDAIAALPIAGARRLKAVAVAEERLKGLFRASFGGLLGQEEGA